MSDKRILGDADPDYEDYDQSSHQNKRLKLMETDGKEHTISKIHAIIKTQFQEEIELKRQEIFETDQRILECREALDRLRACIVAAYYTKAGVLTNQSSVKDHLPSIHPATKKYLGKTLPSGVPQEVKSEPPSTEEKCGTEGRVAVKTETQSTADKQIVAQKFKSPAGSRASRFKEKKRIIVGNVSRYIPLDKRDENDQATHKWMVYVRGPKESPQIRDFVDKIWFFLHPSYRPNDLVEVSEPPFHLTRRGWGEFPVRVQLHFKNQRNKRVDIIHQLKLDRTYTGLQTLGSETVVEIEVERDVLNDLSHSATTPSSLPSSTTSLLSLTDPSFFQQPQPTTPDTIPTDKEGVTITHMASPPLGQSGLFSHSPDAISTRSVVTKDTPSTPDRSDSQSSGFVDLSPASTSVSMARGQRLSQDSVSLPSTPESTRSSEMSFGSEIIKTRTVDDNKYAKITAQGKDNVVSGIQEVQKKQTGSMGFTLCNSGRVGDGKKLSKQSKNIDQSEEARVVSAQPLVGLNLNLGGKSGNQPGLNVAASSGTNTATEPVKYVKCSDNKGRTILVPKNLLPQLELKSRAANVGNNNAETSETGTSERNKSVSLRLTGLEAKNNISSKANVGKSGSVQSKSPQQQIILQGQSSRSQGHVQPGMKLVASPEQLKTGRTVPVIVSPNMLVKMPASLQTKKSVENTGKSLSAPQHLVLSSGPKGTSTSTQNIVLASGIKGASTSVQNVVLTAGLKGASTAPQNLVIAAISKATSAPTQNLVLSAVSKGSFASPPNSLFIANVSTVSKGQSTSTQNLPKAAVTPAQGPVSSNLPKALSQSTTKISGTTSMSSQQPLLIRTPSGQLHLVQGLNRPSLPQQSGQVTASRAPTPSPPASQQKTSGVSLLKQDSGQNVHKFTPTVREILEAKRAEPTRGVSLLRHISPPGVQTQVPTLQQGKPNPPQNPVPLSVIIRCETPGKSPGHVTRPANQPVVLSLPQEAGKSGLLLPQPLILSPGSKSVAVPSSKPVAVPSTGHTPEESVKKTEKSIQGVSLLKGRSSLQNPSDGLNSKVCLTTLGQQGVTPEGHVTSHVMQESQKPEKTFRLIGGLRSQEKTANFGSHSKLNLKELLEKQREEKGPREPKVPKYRLSDFRDFEDLMRTLVRHFPLVAEHPDRSMHPYCAASTKEFLGWNVGKRRAAELTRIAAIRRKAQSILSQGEGHSQSMELWDRRRMIVWCRHHGYTPLDKEITLSLTTDPTPFLSDTHYCSTTDVGELVEQLRQVKQESALSPQAEIYSTDNIDVDILGEDQVDVDTTHTDHGSSPIKRSGFAVDFLPVSPETEFVHDLCSKIGVRLKPVDLTLECQKKARANHVTVYGNVVEEILWKSSQRFVEDLLRTCLSVIFSQNRSPDEISADHVYQALNSRPECDFLTNQHMGTRYREMDKNSSH